MKLGEWYMCTHRLERKQRYDRTGRVHPITIAYWDAVALRTPIKVLVIGKRNVQDGEVWCEEGYNQFSASKYRQAIKVAPNLTTDFYCLPEHLKPI